MASYLALRSEILDDPLTRGYAAMPAQAVADSLNIVLDRQPKILVDSTTVLNRVDTTEYNGLATDKQDRLWQLLGVGNLNPWGVEATILGGIFGPTSTTLANLAAYRGTLKISRAQELGLGRVGVGQVEEVRRLGE